MTKTVFVTFANHDSERYSKNLERLKERMREFRMDLLAFTDYSEIGSPTHAELNYGFKAYAIQKALDLGYTKIVWIDSAVYPVASLDKFLNYLDTHGLMFFENIGHNLGYWCSDVLLTCFCMDREEAFEIPQTMGGLFGLNFEYAETHEFWNKYKQMNTTKTLANGSWTNKNLEVSRDARVRGHRHDQAIASCILYALGYKYLNPMQTFLACCDWYNSDLQISKDVCFHLKSY
jgi:hypothetical protein